jgi:hypothetical protein
MVIKDGHVAWKKYGYREEDEIRALRKLMGLREPLLRKLTFRWGFFFKGSVISINSGSE